MVGHFTFLNKKQSTNTTSLIFLVVAIPRGQYSIDSVLLYYAFVALRVDEVERSDAMECVLSFFFFQVDATSLNVV